MSETIFEPERRLEGRTTKPSRTDADHEGPHVNQEIRRHGVINDGEAPNLFEDVETVTLDDKCFGGVRKWLPPNAETHEPKTK